MDETMRAKARALGRIEKPQKTELDLMREMGSVARSWAGLQYGLLSLLQTGRCDYQVAGQWFRQLEADLGHALYQLEKLDGHLEFSEDVAGTVLRFAEQAFLMDSRGKTIPAPVEKKPELYRKLANPYE